MCMYNTTTTHPLLLLVVLIFYLPLFRFHMPYLSHWVLHSAPQPCTCPSIPTSVAGMAVYSSPDRARQPTRYQRQHERVTKWE